MFITRKRALNLFDKILTALDLETTNRKRKDEQLKMDCQDHTRTCIENLRYEMRQENAATIKELVNSRDMRGARGDYDELKQQIILLREKVFGENSQFCAHGVTPRLCNKCYPGTNVPCNKVAYTPDDEE